MGDFRSGSSGGFGGRRDSGRSSGGSRGGGFGGSRGGFGGSRGGFGGGRDGGRPQMHEVTCDKCGKQCQVPFRPTGDKPVFCSDCFRKNDNQGSFNSSPRGQDRSDRPERQSNTSSSGISQDQFNQLNAKLDKIIATLAEFEEEDADEELDADLDLDDDSKDE